MKKIILLAVVLGTIHGRTAGADNMANSSAGEVPTFKPAKPEAPQVKATDNYAWKRHKDADQFTQMATESIRKQPGLMDLSPTIMNELKAICPRFPGFTPEEKETFWIAFGSILAQRESNFNPKAIWDSSKLKSSKFRSDRPPIVGVGLYQILIPNIKDFETCGKREKALFDPQSNSDCFYQQLAEKLKTRDCLFCQAKPMTIPMSLENPKHFPVIKKEIKKLPMCRLLKA